MSRVVIFGNSGSGKTSLARQFSGQAGIPLLDLDSVAWKEAEPPIRESSEKSLTAIDRFIAQSQSWIIEGCYSSLIAHAAQNASQMYFLNIGVDACVENCRSRPWEPDKYASKEAQDKNLEMLVEWVRTYETSKDEFSLREHQRIFEEFRRTKSEIKSNAEAQYQRMETASVFCRLF